MGTGSGFYDHKMMTRGPCPHCNGAAGFEDAIPWFPKGAHGLLSFVVKDDGPFPGKTQWQRSFQVFKCLSCHDVIVWMRISTCEADRKFTRIYPTRSDHPFAPPDVPAQIAAAYEEACRVRPLSANAAAALARRALQMALRDVVGVKAGRVEEEIDAAKGHLPQWFVDGLHELRRASNASLHPSKNGDTGVTTETDPAVADLTIELVAALFQHLWAGRRAAATLRDSNAGKKSR